MSRLLFRFGFVFLLVTAAGGAGLGGPLLWASPHPAAPAGVPSQDTGQLDAAMFSGLKWRSIGPANMGGRTIDFAVAMVPGRPDAVYAATASGGLWRTTNQGTTWEPIFDDIDGLLSIGDVAVAHSNPNVVWVGTGEANNRQSSPWGDGVYKSVDGARTWQHMGLKETRHVGRIVIHPANPDVVYVAAVGHLWGPNPERGVFRTTDGGASWERVLYIDEHTGATDLVIDPQDPKTLFASMYQRQRSNWGFAGGGPGSGIYRTLDGGDSWQELTDGLPEGDLGRIGLDIYPPDPRLLYAIVEADPRRGRFGAPPPPPDTLKGGVFRSTDRGETWEQLSPQNPRPMYFSQIRIDPRDPKRIYVLGNQLQISDDGGRTFRNDGSPGVHSDQHALWIDPRDPNHLILGNDGGVAISWDRTETWRFIDNLPIGQFYEIAVDMRDPYYVCGGLQDNGSWCIPSATRNFVGLGSGVDGIVNDDAYIVGSGDGFYVLIDPDDHTIVFAESQNGRITRKDLTSGESQLITPLPGEKPGEDGGYRWNWNTPIFMSAHDPMTMYAGGNHLSKSTDRGVTWTELSPDLTTNTDRDTLEMIGRKVTDDTLSRHDGIGSYGNLLTISESPLDPAVLYTGSDDGQIHVTRDGGTTWTNITDLPDLPPFTYVSRVVASTHVLGRVYATFDGHTNDDYRPYVYVSEEFGRDWRSLVSNLPETSINIIREHPRSPNLLFVGHEKGVHVSIDRGESWVSLNINMPPVPVDDLIIHPRENDLIAGTHGRSIWILDDIGPLEASTPAALASDGFLAPVRPAYPFNFHTPHGWFLSGQLISPNPEYGATITYYLGQAGNEAELTISADGEPVRTLKGPAEQGFNRLAWDLRMEPPYVPESTARFGFIGPPLGPTVLPGEYSVTVSVQREGAPLMLTGTVEVQSDPLVDVSRADLEAHHAAFMTAYELQKTLDAAQTATRDLGERLDAMNEALEGEGDAAGAASEELRTRAKELAEEISRVEGDLQGYMRSANNLAGTIRAYTGAPRPDQLRELDWVFEDVSEAVQTLNGLMRSQLPALYAELAAENLWPAPLPTISPPQRFSRR